LGSATFEFEHKNSERPPLVFEALGEEDYCSEQNFWGCSGVYPFHPAGGEYHIPYIFDTIDGNENAINGNVSEYYFQTRPLSSKLVPSLSKYGS